MRPREPKQELPYLSSTEVPSHTGASPSRPVDAWEANANGYDRADGGAVRAGAGCAATRGDGALADAAEGFDVEPGASGGYATSSAGSRATAEALLRSSLSSGELGEEGTAMASRERVSALMNLPMRR